jgi:ApaG protein
MASAFRRRGPDLSSGPACAAALLAAGRPPGYPVSMSSALTDGIRVEVVSDYRGDRSEPALRRWLFTYTVTITNLGESPAQLTSRHWIIVDGTGHREDVRGDGVVGHQPRLEPGESFEYTSFCVLPTAHGSMRGTYQMRRDDGAEFEAEIAPFSLVVPGALN